MTTKKRPLRKEADWYQIAEEFLVTQEKQQNLTVRDFCVIRGDFSYNTARIKLTPKINELSIAARSKPITKLDQRDQLKDDQHDQHDQHDQLKDDSVEKCSKVVTTNDSDNNLKVVKEPSKRKPNNLNATRAIQHCIYAKYFPDEVLQKALSGSLEDDLLLYRAKAITALEFMDGLNIKLNTAIDNGDAKDVEKIVQRLASTEKALSWCITRIESISMNIQRAQLTDVLIAKERANTVKARAQTKTCLHQSNNYRANTLLVKAKALDLEHGNKGNVVYDIIKDIQTRRDLLPSFINEEDE